MSQLPNSYILQNEPKEYLVQGPNHCGMFAIKGILSAYKKDAKKDPRDYQPNRLGRLIGWTFPWTFEQVLSQYGFFSSVGWVVNTSHKEKIARLKELIMKHKAVILLIGNGYQRDGRFNLFRSRFTSHWITIWGYADKQECFYIYDSAVPKNLHDRSIPIGNVQRSYQVVLRDWSALSIPFMRNLYIAVNDSSST